MSRSEDTDKGYLVIARVVSPQGNRGELKAELVTDFPERFASTRAVYLGSEHRRYVVESHRLLDRVVVLKLEGIDSIGEAEQHRGEVVEIPEEDAVELPEGHYYWHQILGLRVVTAGGEELGTIAEILRTGSNDVYVVKGPRGEQLLPAIRDTVKFIDLEAGQMTVEPMEWSE
jgi:16S rRNA processing protein RimM